MEGDSMVSRLRLFSQIERSISLLESEIAAGLRLGRNNINIILESFCCGLLNRVYGYKLDLNNQLQSDPVDLIDPVNSIAVAVTTSDTLAKVTRTVDAFRSHRLHETYRTLIILILSTNSDSRYRELKAEEFHLQIMTLHTLLQEIQYLSTDKLENIAKYLDEEIGITKVPEASSAAPSHRLPPVPDPVPSFVGQEKELQRIRELLALSPWVFLRGAEGIGKTQLALRYCQAYPPRNGAYFLTYVPPADQDEDILRQTILQADFDGYEYTGTDNASRDEEYSQRLEILRSEYAGALLVIDDFRYGRMRPDTELVANTFRDFAMATGTTLLITTRIFIKKNAFTLVHFKPADALALMTYYGAAELFPEEDLKYAAHIMDHIPLLVDQTARLMCQSPEKVPLAQLRTLLPDNVSPRDAVATIQSLLHAPIQQLPAGSRQVLMFASLLPEDGLEKVVFENALTPAQKRGMRSLIQDGWLVSSGSFLSVHPFICQASRDALHPAAEDCRVFLDRLLHYERSFRWERIPLVAHKHVKQRLAQTYATAAETLQDAQGTFSQDSAELWKSAGQISSALHWETRFLQTMRSLPNPDRWELARANHFSGECYSLLREYPEALKSWQAALRLCKKDLPVSNPDLAAAHYYVGYAHLKLGHHQKAAQHLELARNLQQNSLSVSHPLRKAVQDLLDTAYAKLGIHRKALDYLNSDLNRDSDARYLWLPPPAGVGFSAFIGRGEELGKLRDLIRSGIKPVVITGLPGSGKTELVLHFAHNYQEGQVFFTRFHTSFTHTVAGMAQGIRPMLTSRELAESDDKLCSMVLDLLANCTRNDILIIEDAQIPPEGSEQWAKDDTLQKLLALDCRLIFTTQADYPGGVCVQPLPYQDLYAFFKKYDVSLPKAQMDKLIDAVNGHTLMIDLIARTLRDQGSLTAEQVLTAVRSGTPEAAIPTGYDASAEQPLVQPLVRILLDFAQFDETTRNVLRWASLIPPQGIDLELFKSALSKDDAAALRTLVELRWVQINDRTITVPSATRMVCSSTLKPTDENCGAFLQALWQQYSPIEYGAGKYGQMAELYAYATQILEDRNAQCILYADTLWNATGQYLQCKEMYDRLLPKYEKLFSPSHPTLGTIYNNVGRTYSELGIHANALEYTMKALNIFERSYAPDHPALAAAYQNVGMTYFALGNYSIALEYQEKALSILENTKSTDSQDLAAAYTRVGFTYGALGDHEKSLSYFQKSLHLREQTLPQGHPDLARAYGNVGNAYSQLGDHNKARTYHEKSLQLLQTILPAEHPDLGASYSNAGIACFQAGDFVSALPYFEKALAVDENWLPAEHPKLQQLHNIIARIHELLR